MTYTPLDLVGGFLRRFICYPSEHASVAHVLWIAHTHMMEVWDTTPRLAFMSAEKESGKTRALEITALFVPDPILSINASPAVIVRIVSRGPATILYDEIDGVFGNAKVQEANTDLRSVLNGGYRRGARVHRCVVHGATIGIEELDAFAPVAVAGLKELPDTLASRAIFIYMKRRAGDEHVESFRSRVHVRQAKPIMRRLVAWCAKAAANVNIDVDLPEGIEDRAADCWEPLIAIADVAGGDWPERARKAATYLARVRIDDLTKGVELLAHTQEAFGNADKLHTTTLLQRLCNRDESPWLEINYGKPLNERGLAVRLKPYGIKSKAVRIGEVVLKGYAAEDFHDSWMRYLPSWDPLGYKGYKGYKIDNQIKNVTDVTLVTEGMAEPDPESANLDDEEVAYEERAATLEFNGGFTREEAESAALEETWPDLPEFLRRKDDV